MPAFNQITIVGRLVRDPELKYTPAGVAVTNLSIAVDKWQKDDSGQHETNFFNVVLWRQSAEFANNYLKKGHLALVTGSMDSRHYEKDGVKKTVWEITGEKVQSLQPRSDGDANADTEPAAASAKPTPKAAPKKAQPMTDEDMDESDPFKDD